MSFSPERVRVRGRSPAFNALAANFENPNTRNLSTPPPVVRKIYPKSGTPDSATASPKSPAIANISASFERPKEVMIPKLVKGTQVCGGTVLCPSYSRLEVQPFQISYVEARPESKPEGDGKENSTAKSDGIETFTIQEDAKEGEAEDEEGLPVFPYERLKTTSADPVTEIDITKREVHHPNFLFHYQNLYC